MQFGRRLICIVTAMAAVAMVSHSALARHPKHDQKADNDPVAKVSGPVQVFLGLGQSNMWGMGHIAPLSFKGSLERAVQKDHLYPFLVDNSGQWAVFKDVRLVHVMPGRGAGGSKAVWDAYWKSHSLSGEMRPGLMTTLYNQWLTVKGHRFIGPEFGIAHELTKVVHGPTLILKSVIGNRSIGWDLLPPGSKGYTYTDPKGKVWQYAGYGESPNRWAKGTTPKPIGWYAGKEYDMDVTFAKYVLAHLSKYYPGASSYKIAGFFFWQGDKDRYDTAYAEHYEQNLTAFIHAVRKAFDAPKAPFVLATLGQDIKGVTKGNDGLILKAQLDVANPTLHPEFKGNVATVYAHPLSLGGASNGHYNGNAQTYMNVGLAMGKAMDKLLAGQ